MLLWKNLSDLLNFESCCGCLGRVGPMVSWAFYGRQARHCPLLLYVVEFEVLFAFIGVVEQEGRREGSEDCFFLSKFFTPITFVAGISCAVELVSLSSCLHNRHTVLYSIGLHRHINRHNGFFLTFYYLSVFRHLFQCGLFSGLGKCRQFHLILN